MKKSSLTLNKTKILKLKSCTYSWNGDITGIRNLIYLCSIILISVFISIQYF